MKVVIIYADGNVTSVIDHATSVDMGKRCFQVNWTESTTKENKSLIIPLRQIQSIRLAYAKED